MADPRTETELDAEPGVPDPTPEEAARLLAAARRAREDAAAGRVYRTGREGLEALLARFDEAEASGRAGDPTAVDAVIRGAVADGLLRPAGADSDGDAEAPPPP
jgi:hypothetical protein